MESRLTSYLTPALLSVLLLVAGTACEKMQATPLDANTSLLVSHSWRVTGFTDTDNTASPPRTTSGLALFPTYRLDDTYQFNPDYSLTFDDGALKEKTTDPQTATGKWEFDATQQNIAITLRKTVALGTTGITSTSGYTIRKLSADTLRLTRGTQAQTIVLTLTR